VRPDEVGPAAGSRERPGSGNARDSAALAAVGLEPVVDPYLQVSPVADPEPARRLAARLPVAGWLVLSSARTIPAWEALVGADALGEALVAAGRVGLTVAAVGPVTAASLPEGIPVDLIAHRPHAQALLADLLAVQPTPSRALLPGSAAARPTLADGLRAAGWQVEAAAVYDTQPVTATPATAAAVAAGRSAGSAGSADSLGSVGSQGIDAVLLRSPSAVAAVARYAVRPGSGLVVATVGPTTTAAARARGWRPLSFPDPDPERVAERLAAALAQAGGRHTDEDPTTSRGPQ
jgi:uroporphyrinogen-III synthase